MTRGQILLSHTCLGRRIEDGLAPLVERFQVNVREFVLHHRLNCINLHQEL